MELGGQNICPTTFAPHVWHFRGKLGVTLPHLPHLPHHPNRPIYLIYLTIQTGPRGINPPEVVLDIQSLCYSTVLFLCIYLFTFLVPMYYVCL
jgi:hypothetical protein